MRNGKNQIVFNVIGVLFSVGILYFGYRLIAYFISKIDSIDANILIALIAGTVTITGYFITRYLERKKIIEQQIREQKIPVYEEFIEFFFKLFRDSKEKTEIDTNELNDFMWRMNKKSILWLSDKTFKSYVTWKNTSVKFADSVNKSEAENVKMLQLFEQLLLDFREDIGHDNKNIQKGDLLSLFITDWEKYKDKK